MMVRGLTVVKTTLWSENAKRGRGGPVDSRHDRFGAVANVGKSAAAPHS